MSEDAKGFPTMSQPHFDPANLTYNDAGLIPAIAQDAETGDVLMMAWMNADAVTKTLATGPEMCRNWFRFGLIATVIVY
jgi:phosphoribosyl-AMP cyclohydrolase